MGLHIGFGSFGGGCCSTYCTVLCMVGEVCIFMLYIHGTLTARLGLYTSVAQNTQTLWAECTWKSVQKA